MSKLGLRYPPASSIDRESHAARVALLAEDCADIPTDWIDQAAREWAKREPFMPRACELRESALMIGRMLTKGRALPPPSPPMPPPPPDIPLTEDEIAKLPQALVNMGLKLGAIDPDVATRVRLHDQAEDQPK